jgi:hypothetical protein
MPDDVVARVLRGILAVVLAFMLGLIIARTSPRRT